MGVEGALTVSADGLDVGRQGERNRGHYGLSGASGYHSLGREEGVAECISGHIRVGGTVGAVWSGLVWWFSSVKAIRTARGAGYHQHLLSLGTANWGGCRQGLVGFSVTPGESVVQPYWGATLLVPSFRRGGSRGPGGRQDLQTSGRTRMRTWASWLWLLALPMTQAAFIVRKSAQRNIPHPPPPTLSPPVGKAQMFQPSSAQECPGERWGGGAFGLR